MGSIAEWVGQRKELVNYKTKQYKLINLSNRETINWEKKVTRTWGPVGL